MIHGNTSSKVKLRGLESPQKGFTPLPHFLHYKKGENDWIALSKLRKKSMHKCGKGNTPLINGRDAST